MNIRIAISVWITSPSVSSAHILVVEEETVFFLGGGAGLFEANLMNTKLYVFLQATFNRTSHG